MKLEVNGFVQKKGTLFIHKAHLLSAGAKYNTLLPEWKCTVYSELKCSSASSDRESLSLCDGSLSLFHCVKLMLSLTQQTLPNLEDEFPHDVAGLWMTATLISIKRIKILIS